jgi:hypothetical protein
VFRVDYTVEVAGNKEFGSLFLQNGQQQENVALSIVQNGWAKVILGLGDWSIISQQLYISATAGIGRALVVAWCLGDEGASLRRPCMCISCIADEAAVQ